MRAPHPTALVLGIALALASCSEPLPDPTVMLELKVIPAQPWVATGDLVDGGQMCPSGDRHRVRHWHPDGSPMTDVAFVQLIDEANDAGLDVWHVRRVTEREHLCNDGSGAFTVLEDATGPVEQATAEVVGGTGAYTDMTGSCVLELTEDENRQVVEMVTICEFDMGSVE